MTALSRLINEYAGDRSNREIAKLSLACRDSVSQGAVQKYRAGAHPVSPSDAILRAFSCALNIPLAALYQAAGTHEPFGEWVPPPEAHHLSREQRDLITALIKMLVRSDPAIPAARDKMTVVEVEAGRAAARRARERDARKGKSNPDVS